MKNLILLLFLTCSAGHAQTLNKRVSNVSPENEPGINYALINRLVSELNYAYSDDKIRVMPTFPDYDDFENFLKAKTMIDFDDTGISDMSQADSLFAVYLGGKCIVRTSSHKDFIYGNREMSLEDMKWFLKQGVKRVTGIVYRYGDLNQVLICTYEKKE